MKPAPKAAILACCALAVLASRQTPDAAGSFVLDQVRDFLEWAHPSTAECGSPARVEVTARFTGGIVARFEIACGGARRAMGAVLKVREGSGIWQVAGGFEADPERLEEALRGAGWSGNQPPQIQPPPQDFEAPPRPAERTPLDLVTPPQVLEEIHPEYPEEAGRARLIGQARVELLVSVSPGGIPELARALRGPDPDLGMHGAASRAALGWRFRPALLAGRPVRYFASIEMKFEGLPPESRTWVHRALFHVRAVVSSDRAVIEEARRRLLDGEPVESVLSDPSLDEGRGGDWGFVPAASLPPPLRKALHDLPVGSWAGPVAAGDLSYLVRKEGEVYYAIRPAGHNEVSYRVVHEKNAPGGEPLRRIIEADVADHLAESRRRDYVNEASRLMGIHQRQVTVGQLEIHTDALDDEEIRLVGRVVQATIEAHRDLWRPLVPMRPFDQQVLIYALARKSDHDSLHRLWRASRGTPSGLSPAAEYVPASRILSFPTEGMEGHLPIPLLVHEAIHMLDFETIYAAGVQPSQWFEEGLATYFGFSQINSQLRIEPGEIRRSGTIVSGSVRVQFDPRVPLRDYLRRVREEASVPVELLLRARPADPLWGSDRSSRGYGASWTLVHFLRHGDRGRRRTAFEEYARLEARGEGGPGAFARLFGPDLAPLEVAWHEYEEEL